MDGRLTAELQLDLAALAIAQGCAEEEVYGTATCTTSIAQSYFNDNVPGVTPNVPPPIVNMRASRTRRSIGLSRE